MLDFLFSIVICTYNNAEILRQALESACSLDFLSDQYEVIVVDNASADHTKQVFEDCQSRFPKHQLRYFYEAIPGLAAARNQGWQQAQGYYVAFIDDDAKIPRDYLKQAQSLLQEYKPMCLGGPIHPFYTTTPPQWFKDRYEIRTWGNTPRYLQKNECFSGSNMVWDRAVLRQYDGFDPETGVIGNTLRLGEDREIFLRIWDQAYKAKFYYDPTLIVKHWSPDFKMTVSYRLKRAFAEGQSQAQLNILLEKPSPSYRILLAAKNVAGIIKNIGVLITRCRQFPYWQNMLVETGGDIARRLGRASTYLNRKISLYRS